MPPKLFPPIYLKRGGGLDVWMDNGVIQYLGTGKHFLIKYVKQ